MKGLSPISTTCIAIIAVAFTVLATVHPVAASIPTGEVEGVARDIHGQPVESLKISLTNWFGDVSASAVTDAHGRYQIDNVAPGKYYMRIRPLGEAVRGQLIVIDVPPHHLHLNLSLLRNFQALAFASRSSAND
jgi:Carboxypeptidase regulatory-like domain